MNTTIKTNGQTETTLGHQLQLGLPSAPPCASPAARRRRLNRANWWFERMRQIVDRACDWPPAPETRPKQSWFSNPHPQPVSTQ
jgi:hypothetical protein